MNSKILVIDDDHIILFIHRTLIKNSGIKAHVEYFLSAELALEFINEFKDSHNFLLLLDINMPTMSGWEMLDILKDSTFKNNISVVMVTSSINEKDRIKASTYPQVLEYLTKPIKVVDFVALQSHKKIGKFFRSTK